ncbi:MAG: asparagine synthetase B, partial [Bdellovibrionales bacterium]|nr:asparagine synthetase B [Bdellovibrionales bacterium]
MCGIAGALSLQDSFEITPSFMNRMNETMIHRGPDGKGVWVSKDRQVGLAHRRLSIIDLSASAAQPMCNADQSVVITFNGEIYNHQEIRAEIQKLMDENQIAKFCWQTDHSDTEVILRAYEIWGIECIEKFRGMFAFAIWDAKQKALYLVRDRIGIKPLYFSNYKGRLTFASEIKALL